MINHYNSNGYSKGYRVGKRESRAETIEEVINKVLNLPTKHIDSFDYVSVALVLDKLEQLKKGE